MNIIGIKIIQPFNNYSIFYSSHCEPKLSLLFYESLSLCQRQILCGASPFSTCKHVIELVDIFMSYIGEGDASGGTSNVAWNILGAIGITQTPYKPSPRFKFLAASLAYFLLQQIVTKPQTKDKESNGQNKETPDADQEAPILRTKVNNESETTVPSTGELIPLSANKIESLRLVLTSMKKDQAYLGLIENLDWVLEKSLDQSNTFNDACGFVRFIVANNLYTEGYCLTLGDN